ncbi:MAG: Gfo/Idh/MocA family oxidoreductase [Chloroflexi bacterium]|nr:Gfo/Idh/MocA family oxidoreductase [Chloroflexota bacterium]
MARWRVGLAGLQDPRSEAARRQWADLPGVVVAAAAEPDGATRSCATKELGIGAVYPCWEEMLRSEDLHFLHISLPLRERVDLVEEAAARGIHCLLEPPLAASLDQAERMVAAVRRAGVYLLVNWPAGYDPAIADISERLRAEEVGALVSIESRLRFETRLPCPRARAKPTADGEEGGKENDGRTGDGRAGDGRTGDGREGDGREGGASAATQSAPSPAELAALAHGLNLQRWLIGLPSECLAAVRASETEARPTGLLSVLRYRSLIGLVEVSTAAGYPDPLPDLLVRGADGAISVTGAVVSIHRGDRTVSAERTAPYTGDGPQNAPEQLLAAALGELEPDGPGNLQVSRDTQEMLDAVMLSAESGRSVSLPLR